MSSPIDLRDVRPLTSSEIAKILTTLLSGVYLAEPAKAAQFGHLIEMVKITGKQRLDAPELELLAKTNGLWTTAFLSTAHGFFVKGGTSDTWCYPKDVQAALTWLGENLDAIFPPPRLN